jgi:chaperone required for assembly of F1-ATPase
MKRFYKLVSTTKTPNGYLILLDGKPVKTKSRRDLLAPTQAMADAIMLEWSAQGDAIKLATMPLTQILNTMMGRVSAERAAMQDMVLKYFDTDLLCYRTDQPEALAQQQTQTWDPWLAWFEKRFGFSLTTTTSITALKHPAEAHAALKKFVINLNDHQFTVLQLVTSLSGSVILAAAFVDQDISADDLFAAIRIEERYKAVLYDEEKYGPDPAQHKKDAATMLDLKAAEAYLAAL